MSWFVCTFCRWWSISLMRGRDEEQHVNASLLKRFGLLVLKSESSFLHYITLQGQLDCFLSSRQCSSIMWEDQIWCKKCLFFWQAMVWEWWDILLPSSLVDITWRNCRRTKTLACSPRALPFQFSGWEWGGGPSSSSFPTTPSTKSHALLLWIVCFYCAFHWEFVSGCGWGFSFVSVFQLCPNPLNFFTFCWTQDCIFFFFFFFFADGYNTPTLLCYVSWGVQQIQSRGWWCILVWSWIWLQTPDIQTYCWCLWSCKSSFIFFFLLFLQFIPLFDVVNVEANLLHTCRKKATLCVISCCFCCICNYLPVSISLDGCLVEKPCLIFFSNWMFSEM